MKLISNQSMIVCNLNGIESLLITTKFIKWGNFLPLNSYFTPYRAHTNIWPTNNQYFVAFTRIKLVDTEMCFKSSQKLRWLSRWQLVKTLCDYLENIIIYFPDNANAMKDGFKQITYIKTPYFKVYLYFICPNWYFAYFVNTILHVLT